MPRQKLTEAERNERYETLRSLGLSRQVAQLARDYSEFKYQVAVWMLIENDLTEQKLGELLNSLETTKGGS